MKKFKNVLLLAIAALSLAGCDALGGLFGGGDGEDDDADVEDFNLYTIQLTCNMQGEKFNGQRAELNPDAAYDEEEMDYLVEQYGSKGLTKENLQKVGTQDQSTGKYYFMNQDPVYFYSPQVVGYEFLGWYDGNTRIDGGYDYNYDGKTDAIFNMKRRNLVLEARYELINFEIRYALDGETDFMANPTNPTSYNVEGEDIVLQDEERQGMNFLQWNDLFNFYDVSEGKDGDNGVFTTIDNVTTINQDFIASLGDYAYGYYTDFPIDLYGEFEVQKFTINVDWPTEDCSPSFFIKINGNDLFNGYHWVDNAVAAGVEGATKPLSFTCEAGNQVVIQFHIADSNYNLLGFFNGQEVLTTSDTYSFTVSENISIDIKIEYVGQPE